MLVRLFHSFVLSTVVYQIHATPSEYTVNAELSFTTLQSWYNNSTGLWNTTGWWNSANCLTVAGDLAAIHSSMKPEVTGIMANTLVKAQNYNLGLTKTLTPDFNIISTYASDDPTGIVRIRQENPKGFLNGYYDDEGWWALGWIQAYDVTGNTEYLNTAIDIFTDMKNGSTTPCGGIWWDKAHTYVNAIANELYLSVASHLANRAKDKRIYLSIAESQWSWFHKSGMINSHSLINDGLNKACENNNATVWSYNQGVILGALVELSKATSNTSYLRTAQAIASAAMSSLSDSNGVLHDPCEPSCGADGSQFKGVFMRNLRVLQNAAGNDANLQFIAKNAQSIWRENRAGASMLSLNWAGPFVRPANASTQSSALDALVAAMAFEGHGISI